MGYNVIGGINSDFFGNGGVPLGISIEDGIYKSSPEGNNAVATVNGQVSLSVSPQVYITLTNQRDNSTVELTHFNKCVTPPAVSTFIMKIFPLSPPRPMRPAAVWSVLK